MMHWITQVFLGIGIVIFLMIIEAYFTRSGLDERL